MNYLFWIKSVFKFSFSIAHVVVTLTCVIGFPWQPFLTLHDHFIIMHNLARLPWDHRTKMENTLDPSIKESIFFGRLKMTYLFYNNCRIAYFPLKIYDVIGDGQCYHRIFMVVIESHVLSRDILWHRCVLQPREKSFINGAENN